MKTRGSLLCRLLGTFGDKEEETLFLRVGMRCAVVLALMVVALGAHGAPIEEVVVRAETSSALAASGRYTARHTVSGSFEGVDLVDGVAAAKLDFVVEVTNDEGPGFLHGAKGHCIGIALYQHDSPIGSGVCSFKDSDGDVLFMRFVEDPYTSAGTAESMGGTGKYEHIQVNQTHRTLDSDEIDGSRFEATGVRSGVWHTVQK